MKFKFILYFIVGINCSLKATYAASTSYAQSTNEVLLRDMRMVSDVGRVVDLLQSAPQPNHVLLLVKIEARTELNRSPAGIYISELELSQPEKILLKTSFTAWSGVAENSRGLLLPENLQSYSPYFNPPSYAIIDKESKIAWIDYKWFPTTLVVPDSWVATVAQGLLVMNATASSGGNNTMSSNLSFIPKVFGLASNLSTMNASSLVAFIKTETPDRKLSSLAVAALGGQLRALDKTRFDAMYPKLMAMGDIYADGYLTSLLYQDRPADASVYVQPMLNVLSNDARHDEIYGIALGIVTGEFRTHWRFDFAALTPIIDKIKSSVKPNDPTMKDVNEALQGIADLAKYPLSVP